MRRSMIVVVAGLLLATTFAGATAASTNGVAPPESTSVTPELAPDGTFLSAAPGVIDPSRWRLVSDMAAGEPPRLAPAGTTAAPVFNNHITGIAIIGSDLFVGGYFTDVAGIPEADGVARWDGTEWHALGSDGAGDGAVCCVLNIAAFGTTLVVGGGFTVGFHGAPANYVAAWNGSSWSALGSTTALNGYVDAFGVQGADLIVGGGFTDAGGVAEADRIARWNGSAWSALGSNGFGNGALNADVYAIAVSGSNVYAGGDFTDAAGFAEADRIALFNGSTWAALGSNGAADGALNSYVAAIAVSGSNVYVGGDFTNAGGATGDYIALFNGSAWSGLGSDGSGGGALNGYTNAIALSSEGLFVGGGFTNAAANANADYLAFWNGSTWSDVGSVGGTRALNSAVTALKLNGADLIVGGYFSSAGGNTDAGILANWDGTEWTGFVSPGRPDGRIRKGTGAFAGNDIYNADGTNQTKQGAKPRGESITFGISIQNDASTADSFTVHATGASTTMYNVRYFSGTTEITSAVVAGTYQTSSLAPGAKKLITARVKVKSTATVGSSVSRLVTISSDAAPSIVDAVRFIGKRL